MKINYIKAVVLSLQLVAASAIAQPMVAPDPAPGNLAQAKSELEAKLGAPIEGLREISPGYVTFTLQKNTRLTPSQVVPLKNAVPGLEVSPRIKKHSATPNDTLYSSAQSAYFQAGPVGSTSIADALRRVSGTAQTVVAVADTGILPHPELKGRLLPGYDFITDADTAGDGDGADNNPRDEGDYISAQESIALGCAQEATSSWHGTFVAGLIAANSNNNAGISGATFNTQILPIRVLGKCGGSLTDLVDGIRWAAGLPVSGVPVNSNPAKVINLSLGADTASCPAFLQSAVNEIRAQGGVIVASTGNDDAQILNSPANCTGVISVGANTLNGAKSSFSNYAGTTTLTAFGGGSGTTLTSVTNLGTTTPGSTYGFASGSGTSFAAPMVTAAVALGLQLAPTDSPDTIRGNLIQSASAYPIVSGLPQCSAVQSRGACSCNTTTCGNGMLNAQAYIALIQQAGLAVNANSSSAVNAQTQSFVDLPLTPSFSKNAPVTINGYSTQEITAVGGTTITNSNIRFTRNGNYVFEVTGVDSSGSVASSRFSVSVEGISAQAALPGIPIIQAPAVSAPAPAASGGGGSIGLMGLLGLFLGLALFRRNIN